LCQLAVSGADVPIAPTTNHSPRARSDDQVCVLVGVLTNDEVALFQAPHPLCLDAERRDAEVRTRRHQGLPDVQAVGGRYVQLLTSSSA
jgi:hypothetical protein